MYTVYTMYMYVVQTSKFYVTIFVIIFIYLYKKICLIFWDQIKEFLLTLVLPILHAHCTLGMWGTCNTQITFLILLYCRSGQDPLKYM